MFQTLGEREAAGDEFRIRNPVLVDETHPAQSKGLAALPAPCTDVHDAGAGTMCRCQLGGAAGIVEDDDVRTPGTDQVNNGGAVKGGGRCHQGDGERRGGRVWRLAAQHETHGGPRPAQLYRARDGCRACELSHAERTRHGNEQNSRAGVTQTR
jgi:hypothetical protein